MQIFKIEPYPRLQSFSSERQKLQTRDHSIAMISPLVFSIRISLIPFRRPYRSMPRNQGNNGSTRVRILPAILKKAKKIFVYIRSRTWVTAAFAQKFAGPNGSNLLFSEEQKKRWEEHPEEYLAYRKEIELELNLRFRLYVEQAKEQKDARAFSVNQMKEKLAPKPDIIDNLLPEFAVGQVLTLLRREILL